MRYIKRFNESVNYDRYFPLTEEDLEDICLEMIDSGFEFSFSKRWLSNGVKSKEPIKSKSIPTYEISLNKDEDKCSSDNNRWDGSFYLDEYSTLKMFASILKRLEYYGRPYYYISDTRYHISLILNEVEIETGFDWNIFTDEFSHWTETIETNYSDKSEDDLFYLHHRFDRTEAFGGSGGYTYEFRTKLGKDTLNQMLSDSEKDMDNKELYSDLIDLINKKLSKYSKFIDVDITFDYSEPKEYSFNKKQGLFKSKQLTYTIYTLSVLIKPKKLKS